MERAYCIVMWHLLPRNVRESADYANPDSASSHAIGRDTLVVEEALWRRPAMQRYLPIIRPRAFTPEPTATVDDIPVLLHLQRTGYIPTMSIRTPWRSNSVVASPGIPLSVMSTLIF